MIPYKLTILTIVIIQFSLNIKAANTFEADIDCSEGAADESSAECVCRFAKNRWMDICQNLEWFQSDKIQYRIINGEAVEADVYPWFARAINKNSGAWGGCGGSLVSSEYVLTAAHCVEPDSIESLKSNGGYQIGALCAPYGPSDLKNCGQKVETFGIREIIPHPNYVAATVVNDFALIRLDGVSSVIPVQMDMGNISPGYENMNLKSNLWPVGFGTNERGSLARNLMHVNVNYVKQSTCNSNYNGDITNEMMCAADFNQDSCQGDSGGPLYDSDNNVIVGVVSWGQGCADANFPGVYARISNQFSWIRQVICADHGDPKPSFCSDNPPPPPPLTPGPPAPAPPAPGPPACVDTPENWHDSDGPYYNCKWYADTGSCASFGDAYVNFGKTANQACCECGGGSTTDVEQPPATSPPTKSPSPLPTSSPMQMQAPTKYPIKSPTESPTKSPAKSPTKLPTKSPTKSPTKLPTKSPTPTLLPSDPSSDGPSSLPSLSVCQNTPKDWHDSDDSVFDCDWYAQGEFCEFFGDGFANNGVTANQACCACGGGSTGSGSGSGSDSDTSQPTPGPSRPNTCPSGQMLLEVEVITDSYGEVENRFQLDEENNNSWNEIWKEDSFQSSSFQSYQQCLSITKCYKFTMIDSYEDGMCCTHGSGGYVLYWEGVLLTESNFVNGEREETTFNC